MPATKEIPAMTAAAALGGTETFPGVQSAANVKITAAQIKTYALGAASALSAPGLPVNGTWITGGSTTTTKPHALIEPAGTTSTGWSTGGTGLGVNAPSGFAGNLIDLQVAGVTQARVSPSGNGVFSALTISSAGNILLSSRWYLTGASDGAFTVNNAGGTLAFTATPGASGLATFGGGLAATTFLKSGSYTVATKPSASAAGAGARIYISDEAGGATPAFSDATDWRRYADRAIIS